MNTAATRRAVQDVLTHGLRGDLAHSAVGVELGQQLQSGLTSDVADGASVKFGDEWVRFDSEAQADFVRTLAASRMAPRKLAIPPAEVAAEANATALAFIEGKQRELREGLAERISDQDPGYADAFVQCLGRLAAAVRTELHAHEASAR